MTAESERSPAAGEPGEPGDLGDLARELVLRLGPGPDPRLFFAPGRVNLMGAHLDYSGGPVMPTAIDRGTLLALRPRADRRIELSSTVEAGGLSCELDELPEAPQGTWTDYPVGVLRHLLEDREAPRGVDVLVGGNLPIGAGLSSSASICVGTAFALDRFWGLDGGAQDWIGAALFAEREFVGVQCGIMDPYAVALTRPGHLLWLDCKDGSFEHVPLDPVGTCICVADTRIRRELARGDFNRRVAECSEAFGILRRRVPEADRLSAVPLEHVLAAEAELGPLLLRRARHVATEMERVFRARSALEAGDLAGFGRAMGEAHVSLRDDYEVSLPELDGLVETALATEGVYGARLTGAGFGGCIVALCRSGTEERLRQDLVEAHRRRFGVEPIVEFFRSDAGPRELAVDGALG